VAARVAHLLAERAEREDDLLVVRLTQQEIAALVASTRDPVAKGIRRLRELGLIETRRGRVGIVVGDRQALADFRDESL
jgi:CRP-like cAMP-binding protein